MEQESKESAWPWGLALAYGVAWIVGLGGWGAVNFALSPPSWLIWDEAARTLSAFAGLVLMPVAALGLGRLIGQAESVRSYGAWPVFLALAVTGLALAVGRLAPRNAPSLPWRDLGIGLALSIGLGCAAWFAVSVATELMTGLAAASPGRRASPRRIEHGLIGVCLLAGLGFVTGAMAIPRAPNNGDFVRIDGFGPPDRRIGVEVRTEPVVGNRYAQISIADGARLNVFRIDRDKDWEIVEALWSRARSQQGGAWRPVAVARERRQDDPSRLRLSAGPGVRFEIVSRRRPAVSFELRPEDAARFDAALGRARLQASGR